MTLFIQTNAIGAGSGSLDPNEAAANLAIVVNGDTGLGVGPTVLNRQKITYAKSLSGDPVDRLDALVNTVFKPNYGNGLQTVDIIILPVGANFYLNDGSSILTVGGAAVPPANTTLGGHTLNNTNQCLVIYDTSQHNGANWWVVRKTGGTKLCSSNPVILYHELSHAHRIVTNSMLSLTPQGSQSSPEEHQAIDDENVLRKQMGATKKRQLRDPTDHSAGPGNGKCPSCCIIASVASGSPLSPIVEELRELRDAFLRRSEVGFAFFRRLFYDYYAFSPQVCTLMARDPALPKKVLAGYVRPLLIMLRTMKMWSFEDHDAVRVGAFFLTHFASRDELETSLHDVRESSLFWLGDSVPDAPLARDLAQLLKARAWPSEHVRWALVEPVRIYLGALELAVRDTGAKAVGEWLAGTIQRWAMEVPLDHLWASLPAAELARELANAEKVLLKSDAARIRFRARLLEAFGSVEPIRRLLAGDRRLRGVAT
jgi:hypothetical protein